MQFAKPNFVLVLLLAGCSAPGPEAQAPLSVCEILQHPQNYNNRSVTFSGFIFPSLHNIMISAEACRDKAVVISPPLKGESGQIADGKGWPYGTFKGTIRVIPPPSKNLSTMVLLTEAQVVDWTMKKPIGPYP